MRTSTPFHVGPVRGNPPHRATPFRDSIAEGGGMSHAFCLVFMWNRATIAEIPLFYGSITPKVYMLGGGVSRPISSC